MNVYDTAIGATPMRTACWIFVSVISALVFGTASNAGERFEGQRSKELDDAFEAARASVVRIVATPRKGDVSQGSAVLLKVRKEESHSYGYFLTCAHVIAGVTKTPEFFRLNKKSGVATVPIDLSDMPVKFLADQDHDLAILRVPLLNLENLIEIDVETRTPKPRGTAYGFGFGIFAAENLHSVTMQIGATVSAANYLSSDAKDRDWHVLQATRERFAGGMSGGPLLAVSEKGSYKLVAIMFATDHNGAELTIPALHIPRLLDQSMKVGANLKDLNANFAAEIKVPFRKEVEERLGRFGYRDVVEWSGLSSWVDAFSSAQGFRERFQEILIEDRTTVVKDGKRFPMTFRIHPETVAEGESVEVWLNGFRTVFSHANKNQEIALEDHLVSGDNLLAVRKLGKRRAAGIFDLNDLLRTNSLAFTLRIGDEPYIVSRSLPALVENYSLYVTLRRSEKERENKLQPDEQIRFAVRVDAVERFLNGIPFLISLADDFAGPDGRTVARVKGDVVFAAMDTPTEKWKVNQFVRIDARSGQTVDLALRGRVANLASDVAGIQIGFDESSKTLPFEFRSRLHFVRERSGPFHVTMRATAATSSGDFKVPLLASSGVRVQADLAGLVTEVGLQWLNNRYLKPEEPRMLARERLGKLLSEIGGADKGLESDVSLRRAFLTEVGGKLWLVITLGVPSIQSKAPDLPLYPIVDDGRIIDIVGRQIPLALAAELARLGRKNGDAFVAPPAGTMNELAFALIPSTEWWKYPETTDPLLDRAKNSQPGQLLADAWKSLLRTSDVKMRVREQDMVALLSELSPTIRWSPLMDNRPLSLDGNSSSFGFAKGEKLNVKEIEIAKQKVKVTGLNVVDLRVKWGMKGESSFEGRISAKEMQLGASTHRLTDIQAEISVMPPASGAGSTTIKLANPRAKVHLPGLEFGVKAGQSPWILDLKPGGRISGRLRMELDNGAGRTEFEFSDNGVRLIAADIELSRVKGIKEEINKSINKAIGFPIDMDLDTLRIDTASKKMTIHLTLKKRIINNIPKINEEIKLPIREEVDLAKALKDKKIVWNAKVGPLQIKIAEFNLPIEQLRRVVDLDAILGKGWDK